MRNRFVLLAAAVACLCTSMTAAEADAQQRAVRRARLTNPFQVSRFSRLRANSIGLPTLAPVEVANPFGAEAIIEPAIIEPTVVEVTETVVEEPVMAATTRPTFRPRVRSPYRPPPRPPF